MSWVRFDMTSVSYFIVPAIAITPFSHFVTYTVGCDPGSMLRTGRALQELRGNYRHWSTANQVWVGLSRSFDCLLGFIDDAQVWINGACVDIWSAIATLYIGYANKCIVQLFGVVCTLGIYISAVPHMGDFLDPILPIPLPGYLLTQR